MPLTDLTGSMVAEHVVAMAAWGVLVVAVTAGRAPAAVRAGAAGLGLAAGAAVVATGAPLQWVFSWLAVLAVLAGAGLGHVGAAGAGLVPVGITLAHALPITHPAAEPA